MNSRLVSSSISRFSDESIRTFSTSSLSGFTSSEDVVNRLNEELEKVEVPQYSYTLSGVDFDSSEILTYGQRHVCLLKMLEIYLRPLRRPYNISDSICLHLPIKGETAENPLEENVTI